MIRQICPHCFRSVQVPPGSAGTSVPCPVCGNVFPVPASYNPAVDPAAGPSNHPRKEPAPVATDVLPTDRPPPPPGFVPSAGPTAAEPYPAVSGYEKTAGFAISPKVLGWIPPVCFTMIFLLTFFTWVGMYPGGYAAYTQNAWQAAFGDFTSENFLDEVLNMEAELSKRVRWNLFLVPYLLGLVVALALGWLERIVGSNTDRLSPQVQEFWKYRFAVLAGLSAILLLLLAFQIRVGFGLESAAREKVKMDFQAEMEKAGETTRAREKIYVRQGQVFDSYGLKSTSWLALVIAAHIVALTAAAGKFFLDSRGDKPPPRVAFSW